MSVGIDKLASELQRVLDEKDSKKKTPYDTEAEVVRVDIDTVWVKIPGGVDETPAQKTVNAKVGDRVQVRVSGGRAFLVGNGTNPPTDDTKANEASYQAQNAEVHAVNAELAASDAHKSAENARIDASVAHEAAERAADSADIAQEEATQASHEAVNASISANSALAGLSIVEDVVGMLEWLAEHRTLSADTTVVDKKIYYTYNEETGAISRVSPDGTENPSEEGWYEMSDAMGDYVSTHLALTSTGLWIVKDGTSAQLQLNENGMSVYPAGSNIPIATYGADATIGDANGFHITITANYNDSHEGRLSFYRDGTNEVAYVSGDSLYINKSVVVQQMNVGLTQGTVDTSTGEIGHGQWSWKVHQNTNGLNNLYLKWLG